MASNLSSLPPRILTFGPERRAIDIGLYARIAQKQPLLLECGRELQDIPIAYQAFGTLNAEKSNAILICHALTGDQFVLGTHPVTGKDGWWTELVGPGKPVDTDQYYVICSNILGGCMGSYGPKDIDPDTGESYGIRFPVLTIRDMVRAQALLLETLGIHRLHSIIGGSMGGMQVLEWLRSYPERVNSAVVTATAARHTPQNIAFHEIGRQAVMADPEWCEGRYTEEGRFPSRGLAVARMTAHVTYLSEEALSRKFGRNLQNRQQVSFGFDADFQVESYLRHQGKSFVERFDPNSYLYITRAVDYFDLAQEHNGRLSEAFSKCDARVCVAAFSSDWLFPPSESRAIVRALSSMAAHVSYVEIETDKGHDAFLLDVPEFTETVRGFLRGPKTVGKS